MKSFKDQALNTLKNFLKPQKKIEAQKPELDFEAKVRKHQDAYQAYLRPFKLMEERLKQLMQK